MVWTAALRAEVRASALSVGFNLVEIASGDEDYREVGAGADSRPDSESGGRFAAWVDAGRAGEMEYLKRRDAEGAFLRSGLRVAYPWARSVVVCALNYESELPRSIDPAPAGTGWIGRYAWSGKNKEQGTGNRDQRDDTAGLAATDYHDELLRRLRLVEARMRQAVLCETRCFVDTGPIVEREFAAKAGVGWIGKNTCVINQELGSWLLLGVIATSLSVAADSVALPAPDRCGSCTRCIDACPTAALVAPREMDASRCIAYLTIEKKNAIAAELREGMGRQVFGCDICQDVCPWNDRRRSRLDGKRRASESVTEGMEPRPALVNPPLAWLAAMDARQFKRWFKGSPLERTGRKRLLRNVAIAMGNSGDRRFLARLREWVEGEDATLAEAAQWAVEQILRPEGC